MFIIDIKILLVKVKTVWLHASMMTFIIHGREHISRYHHATRLKINIC
uniref:Uncharacterized protein n=1 Tax=Arundo donax TaxID=35708 RepID=A0A0A9HM65_ARUDO